MITVVGKNFDSRKILPLFNTETDKFGVLSVTENEFAAFEFGEMRRLLIENTNAKFLQKRLLLGFVPGRVVVAANEDTTVASDDSELVVVDGDHFGGVDEILDPFDIGGEPVVVQTFEDFVVGSITCGLVEVGVFLIVHPESEASVTRLVEELNDLGFCGFRRFPGFETRIENFGGFTNDCENDTFVRVAEGHEATNDECHFSVTFVPVDERVETRRCDDEVVVVEISIRNLAGDFGFVGFLVEDELDGGAVSEKNFGTTIVRTVLWGTI